MRTSVFTLAAVALLAVAAPEKAQAQFFGPGYYPPVIVHPAPIVSFPSYPVYPGPIVYPAPVYVRPAPVIHYSYRIGPPIGGFFRHHRFDYDDYEDYLDDLEDRYEDWYDD